MYKCIDLQCFCMTAEWLSDQSLLHMACEHPFAFLALPVLNLFLLPFASRVGLAQVRSLFWMNTVLEMVWEDATGTCATLGTCWNEQTQVTWLTQHCYTTASLSVPPMSMATGIRMVHDDTTGVVQEKSGKEYITRGSSTLLHQFLFSIRPFINIFTLLAFIYHVWFLSLIISALFLTLIHFFLFILIVFINP